MEIQEQMQGVGAGSSEKHPSSPTFHLEDWQEQMRSQVDTLVELERYINVTREEREAIASTTARWGTTPYFASLMDPNDPDCPIRRQVIPSKNEEKNRYGIENYLVYKKIGQGKRKGRIRLPDNIVTELPSQL